MKQRYLLLVLTLIAVNSFGQILFEKGYFIDNDNNRIECLIKNYDWRFNPENFEYKLDLNEETNKRDIKTAKEFGIVGTFRYVRVDVKIDISPWEMSHLSKDRDPLWSQQQLFLKVLIEGKATLYYYEGKDLARYFFSVSDSSIKQLIYKEYFTEDEKVAVNHKFREQLWLNLRCENASMSSVEKINCTRTDLEKYFIKYNDCCGISSLIYRKNNKQQAFHLRITPGVTISNVSVEDDFYIIYNTEFKNEIGYRVGMEGEYILPFNKNKWGVLFEPSFQHLSANQYIGTVTAKLTVNSIEFAAGLRHYFFLNNDLTLFINALYIPAYSLDFNSTIENNYPFASLLDIKTMYSIALGGGIGFKRLSAEMRYYSKKNMLDNIYWISKGSSFSIILGFKIF